MNVRKTVSMIGLMVCTASASAAQRGFAEITDVSASKALFGSSYALYATIRSSDEDCSHYVNWWEAVSEDGQLLYRRVLGHPHANEQPFRRGGSTSAIKEDTVFFVRAHMHPSGYSHQGMKGSAAAGFTTVEIPAGFAEDLATQGERPTHCDASAD